jgi:hypothetical protein
MNRKAMMAIVLVAIVIAVSLAGTYMLSPSSQGSPSNESTNTTRLTSSSPQEKLIVNAYVTGNMIPPSMVVTIANQGSSYVTITQVLCNGVAEPLADYTVPAGGVPFVVNPGDTITVQLGGNGTSGYPRSVTAVTAGGNSFLASLTRP